MVGVEEVLAVIARSAETLIHGFEDHFVRQLGGGIPCHLSLWHIHPVLVVFNVLALDLDGGFEIIVRYFVVGGSEVLYMLGSDPWTHFGERAEPAIEVAARIGRYLHCDLVPGRRCGLEGIVERCMQFSENALERLFVDQHGHVSCIWLVMSIGLLKVVGCSRFIYQRPTPVRPVYTLISGPPLLWSWVTLAFWSPSIRIVISPFMASARWLAAIAARASSLNGEMAWAMAEPMASPKAVP